MEQILALNCKTASIAELKDAFWFGKPIIGFDRIATHFGPHNDELFSGYILQKTPQGQKRFPGLEKVIFGCIGMTQLRKYDLLGTEGFFRALQMGIFLLGIGGGPTDEHGDRKNRISCTQRIIELLQLQKDPYYKSLYNSLIDYVNYEDSNGDNIIQALSRVRQEDAEEFSRSAEKLSKRELRVLTTLQFGSFAKNLKKGFEAAGDDLRAQGKIITMAYTFYDNELSQTKCYLDAKIAYTKTTKHVVDLKIPQKEGFVLIAMESDVPCMNKVVQNNWANRPDKKKLGVLFLYKSNGQFVLMPNMQYITPTHMREVVKILRQKIAINRKQESIRFCELGKNEFIEEAWELYFDENMGIISNGSKVDPETPGLIRRGLSVDDVIEAVQIGLDTDFFPPEFKKGCEKGVCVRNRCWMHKYAQERCFDVKDKEKISNSPIGSVLVKALEKKGERKSA